MSRFSKILLILLVLSAGIDIGAQTRTVRRFAEASTLPAERKAKRGLVKVLNNIVCGGIGDNAGAFAFDDLYAYLGTPNGVYRTPLPITSASSFSLVAFSGKRIFNLYVRNNILYVVKQSMAAADHSFVRSEDHGETYLAMDQGLEYCYDGTCAYLMPSQALFKDNLIFLNAPSGPNLVVSANNGTSWVRLMGIPEPGSCSTQPFEIINERVLVGGECPLDFAYLRAGTLRPDMLDWLPGQQPAPVIGPNLWNRNIQFIKHRSNTSEVYAGSEGGLLKSTDLGHSFRYVFECGCGARYPYVKTIFFLPQNPNIIVIGGFDKGRVQLFLAYSKDNGENWIDISDHAQALVGPPSDPKIGVDTAVFIREDPDGRILVGIMRPETTTLTLLRLRVDVAAFR